MQVFPDAIGWLATVIFGLSYFCRGARLRLVQGIGSVLWMCYGIAIHAVPVIVANMIVSSIALFSAWRGTARS